MTSSQPSPATSRTSPFDLPDRLAAKRSPDLIGTDETFFAHVTETIDATLADLAERLDTLRRTHTGSEQDVFERDQEVHRLSARQRTLRRFGLDVCLGRMDGADGSTTYVGRLGLTDRTGERILVDWRSPVAEPFFAATHADPHGLRSRRRYRWSQGRVTDYWDEVFDAASMEGHAALDDQSAFVASLGASRSPQMRDVLGTIAADQDAIIRAGSRGALVVDGGPGTGKTVVALHRTAYLLYADPRLGREQRTSRGGVLFVGPSAPYLTYVADVLPSLGEEGVATATLRDLVPEGAVAVAEQDAAVARLKADARLVDAIEPAVRLYEEPPTEPLVVETPWADVELTAADWAEAFAAPDPGTPHNDARDQVWDELLTILVEKHELDEDAPREAVRRSLASHEDLRDVLGGAWPTLEPTDVVGDLWSVPAYLRRCAPWLAEEDVRRLQRRDPHAWTTSDLPLLDAARRRLGDPEASRRRRRREAAHAADRARREAVIDHAIETDDSEMKVMSMLRGADLRGALDDPALVPQDERDRLDGPFAHVVVDEAQELTDAEWRMVLDRCPSRSLTIVGDRAQARHGFAESWAERLARVGVPGVELASLSLNYRTPAEVMEAAEPVIRAALPDANVPRSVRSTGEPVGRGAVADLDDVVDGWLAAHPEGTAAVIGIGVAPRPSGRVQTLTPELAKGLEFDLVVLVGPQTWGGGIEGAVDRYVAMTRATQRLVVLDRVPTTRSS